MKKSIIFGLLFIVMAMGVSATIIVNDPTPANGSSNTDKQITINFTTDNHTAFIDINRSLVAWYRFEKIGSNIINDSSTYGNNGTLNGNPTLVTGMRGNGMHFNGTQWINMSFTKSLNITGSEISICFWVKFDTLNTTKDTYITLVGRGHSWSQGKDIYGPYTVGYDARTTEQAFDIKIYNETYVRSNTYTIDHRYNTTDEWYHVCSSYNRTIHNLYLNGELEDNASWIGELAKNNTYSLRIGSEYNDNWFNGTLDEVMIFSRAISQDEVRYILRGNSDAYSSIDLSEYLVARWNMTSINSTGWIQDSSGNDHDCLMINFSSYDTVDGINGRGIYFNGLNQYVDCGNSSYFSLNMTNQMTYSVWLYLNATEFTSDAGASDSNGVNILEKQYPPTGSEMMLLVYNLSRSDRPQQFSFYEFNASGGLGAGARTTGYSAPTGEWIHVVGVANYSDNRIRIYVNGQKAGETTFTSYSITANSTPAHFRWGTRRRTTFFNGSIADVRVYNKSLSHEEVYSLYTTKNDIIVTYNNISDNGARVDFNMYEQDITGNINNVSRYITHDCVYPYDGLSVSDTTLCNGYYYLIDTGADGLLRILSSDKYLKCNGAILNGDDSGTAIYFQDKDRINVSGCKLNDYAIGIHDRGNSANITNNTINSCARGVRIRDGSYNNVENNVIENSSVRAIQIDVISDKNNVSYNTLRWNEQDIYLEARADENIIRYNTIWNGTGTSSSIQIVGSNNNTISSNVINLSGWNSIDLSGNNTIVEYNRDFNPNHGSTDMLDLTPNKLDGQGTIIRYNNFSHNIVIRNHKDNQIYWNNIVTEDTVISIQGNQTVNNNNTIHNNTLENTNGSWVIIDGSNGSVYTDNIITNGIIRVEPYFNNVTQMNNIVFYNNIFSTGVGNYYIPSYGENVNISINESSSSYHLIELASGATFKLDYNGNKDIRVENTTVYARGLPTNSFYCNTTSTTCFQNLGSFTETMASGYSHFQGLSAASDPRVISMATTITEYNWSYSADLDIDCVGSGNHQYTNLTPLRSPTNEIDIYHNELFSERIREISHTLGGCSIWSFRTASGNTPLSSSSPTSRVIITQVLAVLLAISTILIFVPMYTNYKDLTVNQYIYLFIVGLIWVALVAALLRTIFNV